MALLTTCLNVFASKLCIGAYKKKQSKFLTTLLIPELLPLMHISTADEQNPLNVQKRGQRSKIAESKI